MITCESCGKFTDGQDVGNHWICKDCKIESQEETKDKPSIQ